MYQTYRFFFSLCKGQQKWWPTAKLWKLHAVPNPRWKHHCDVTVGDLWGCEVGMAELDFCLWSEFWGLQHQQHSMQSRPFGLSGHSVFVSSGFKCDPKSVGRMWWKKHSEVQLRSNLSSQTKSCKSWKHCESHVKQKKPLQSKVKGVWTLRPEQIAGLPDACGTPRNSESGVDIWSVWRSKCKMPLLDSCCVMENAKISGRTGPSQLVTTQANNRLEGIRGIRLQ